MAGAGPSRTFSTRFAVTTQRPVAILMIVTAVCVFGWVSYQRLSLDLMPDIAYPAITVRTEFPGTAPEEVESLVSRPLEQELGIVRQLVRISSISKAGQSDVVLEFEWNTDMDAASQSIREKSDRLRLPEDAEKPLLLRYDPSLDPIIRLGLHGPQTMFDLRRLADREIKRELEAIPGVAAVKVKGGLEEQIHVDLNEQRISLMGLDVSAINRALDQANVNLPGGQMREGLTWYLVRTINEFRTVDEIRRLIVAEKEGAEIRLGDVATVHRSSKDREVVTRVDGRESVEIEIYKEADANIVSVAQRVANRIHGLPEQRQYVARLQLEEEEKARAASGDTSAAGDEKAAAEEEEEEEEEEGLGEQKRAEAVKTLEHLRMTDFISHLLPGGMEIEVLSDQSVFIVDAIDEVRKSALIGGALAIFVLLAFLRNVMHTLIVGVTIPVSIAATFAPMYLFDVSMNIMSLGGLALGIGMLVDNSIVVLESIFRCREEGDDLVRATVRGTGEVGAAVFASTLTTIAVFFPIVFVEGVAGQVFGDMALTVVFSLLASLLAALYFIPMLASGPAAGGWRQSPARRRRFPAAARGSPGPRGDGAGPVAREGSAGGPDPAAAASRPGPAHPAGRRGPGRRRLERSGHPAVRGALDPAEAGRALLDQAGAHPAGVVRRLGPGEPHRPLAAVRAHLARPARVWIPGRPEGGHRPSRRLDVDGGRQRPQPPSPAPCPRASGGRRLPVSAAAVPVPHAGPHSRDRPAGGAAPRRADRVRRDDGCGRSARARLRADPVPVPAGNRPGAAGVSGAAGVGAAATVPGDGGGRGLLLALLVRARPAAGDRADPAGPPGGVQPRGGAAGRHPPVADRGGGEGDRGGRPETAGGRARRDRGRHRTGRRRRGRTRGSTPPD